MITNGETILTSLTDRPSASSFGVGSINIINSNYNLVSTSDGTNWTTNGSANSLADRPSAADFGVGTCQVGGALYASDGVSYRIVRGNQISKKSVVLLGDSITDVCLGLRPSGAFSAPMANSYWAWTNAALGWPFDNVINAGVSGDNSTDALNRFDTDVLPFSPDILVVECGTNDALQTNSENYDSKYSSFVAAIDAIIDKAFATSVSIVCLVTVGPFGSAVAAEDIQLKQRARINQYLRYVASSSNNICIADWDSFLTDPTTNARPIGEVDGKSAIYNDNLVHPNGAGATLMGDAIAKALINIASGFKFSLPRGLSPAQYISNPTLSGASGATPPTNWTFASLSSPATTVTFSYETRTDGINGNQLVVALDSAGSGTLAQLQNFTVYTAGILSVGDKVRCALEVEFSGDITTDAQIGLYFAATTVAAAIISSTNFMHDASINSGGSTRVVNSSGRLPSSMTIVTDELTIEATVAAFLIKIRLAGKHSIKIKSCCVFKIE